MSLIRVCPPNTPTTPKNGTESSEEPFESPQQALRGGPEFTSGSVAPWAGAELPANSRSFRGLGGVRLGIRPLGNQSAWNTSSIPAHHSSGVRFFSGCWQGLQRAHHFWVVGSAAIFAVSAAKSLPVYSK